MEAFSLLKQFNWKMAKESEEAAVQFRGTCRKCASLGPRLLLLVVPSVFPPGDLAGAGPVSIALSSCPLLFACIAPTHPSAFYLAVTSGNIF